MTRNLIYVYKYISKSEIKKLIPEYLTDPLWFFINIPVQLIIINHIRYYHLFRFCFIDGK